MPVISESEQAWDYAQILPVVCVLGAAAALHFRAEILLAAALILQFPPTPLQFWNIPERFPVSVAFGRETREHFLERALGGYAAVQYLNRVMKPGDRVLGVETEQVRFYLNAALDTLADSTLDDALRDIASIPPGEDLLHALDDSGFAYILTTRGALTNPPAWYPYLNRDFLSRFAILEFSDQNVAVYALRFP